jgi:hypothetical protein
MMGLFTDSFKALGAAAKTFKTEAHFGEHAEKFQIKTANGLVNLAGKIEAIGKNKPAPAPCACGNCKH